MKHQFLRTLFLVLACPVMMGAPNLYAEDQVQNFCPDSSLAEDFVKQAIVLCMQDLPSQRSECMRDAEIHFNRCHLKGNFRRISSRVQTKLIVLSLFRNLVSPPNDRYKVAANDK